MKLVIDISALDKTRAAVNSTTDTTPVSSLQNLTLGDSEPLDITFTDSSLSPPSAPSWAGQAGYTLVVGIGTMDANALLNYTATTSFTGKTGGWTGRIALTSNTLLQAMIMGVQIGNGGLINVATDPRSRNIRPNWAYFWIQIQVVDPSGNATSYAVLRVQMLNRTLPPNAVTLADPNASAYAWILANFVGNRSSITGLASIVASNTKLGGLTTAGGLLSAGTSIELNFPVTINDGGGTHAGLLTMFYQLVASTHATAWPLWGRPYDYDASTNALVWRLTGAFIDTLPASYNADTAKFHYLGAAGSAGSVYLYADQTGTSAPA